MLGDIPLLGYKSSMAGPATERIWGKGVRKSQGLAHKDSHSTPGSLHPRDELLNDAVLFFLETTQTKKRGFSRYIEYFLANGRTSALSSTGAYVNCGSIGI